MKSWGLERLRFSQFTPSSAGQRDGAGAAPAGPTAARGGSLEPWTGAGRNLCVPGAYMTDFTGKLSLARHGIA